MNTTNRAALTVVLCSLATLSGCVVAVGNRSARYSSDSSRVVTRTQFERVVESNKTVHLGMPREAVLATYPADLLTKFESAQYDGHELEVWQVRAITTKGDRSFERWLYFVDGSLVEMSRLELDFRDDPGALARWLAG